MSRKPGYWVQCQCGLKVDATVDSVILAISEGTNEDNGHLLHALDWMGRHGIAWKFGKPPADIKPFIEAMRDRIESRGAYSESSEGGVKP